MELLAEGVAAGLARPLRVPRPAPGLLYEAACLHALCSDAAAIDFLLPEAEREWRQEAHAMRALGLLKKARAAGYFKAPGAIHNLHKDNDLNPLRERADFQAFLAEVLATAKKPKP